MPDCRSPVSRLSSTPPSRRDLLSQGSVALLLLGMPSSACAQAETIVDRFADIAARNVPDSVRVIRTRGWHMFGVGGARYVFDPRVDRSWVARYPRSATISANGRGFRLEDISGDVRQYGALGDGSTNDADAINEALSRGGTVRLTGPATYFVVGRLLVAVARTRLVFDKHVTLRIRAWRYRGSQTPFGNAVHVTADDCEVVGDGPTSILRNDGGDANGIGFLHCGGGRVTQVTLEGGKEKLSAIVDDTFQSGISIVNDHVNNPRGRSSATVVEDCIIRDWMQYGINIYGDLASGIVVRRTIVTRSGKAGDRESVGAGIALTRGIGPVLIENVTVSSNKGYGIFISSAGAEINDVTVSHARIFENGLDGIRCSEEKHFGASGDIGLRMVTISDNRIESNGGSGVRAGTYDGVGSIRNLIVRNNRIVGNRESGVLLQANNAPGRDVDAVVEQNEFIDNGDYGVAIGLTGVDIRHSGNHFERNRRGPTIDYRGGTARSLGAR